MRAPFRPWGLPKHQNTATLTSATAAIGATHSFAYVSGWVAESRLLGNSTPWRGIRTRSSLVQASKPLVCSVFRPSEFCHPPQQRVIHTMILHPVREGLVDTVFIFAYFHPHKIKSRRQARRLVYMRRRDFLPATSIFVQGPLSTSHTCRTLQKWRCASARVYRSEAEARPTSPPLWHHARAPTTSKMCRKYRLRDR